MSTANWILSVGLALSIGALIAAGPMDHGPGEEGPPHRQTHHRGHPPHAMGVGAERQSLDDVPDQVLARVVRSVPGAAIVGITRANPAAGDEDQSSANGYDFQLMQHGVAITAHVDDQGHITRLQTQSTPGPAGSFGQRPPHHQGQPPMWHGSPQSQQQFGPPPPGRHGSPHQRHPGGMHGPPPMHGQGMQKPPCPQCRQHHGPPPGQPQTLSAPGPTSWLMEDGQPLRVEPTPPSDTAALFDPAGYVLQ